jgi:HPt (histidine-containing phosphotransfer) domain-containing protein
MSQAQMGVGDEDAMQEDQRSAGPMEVASNWPQSRGGRLEPALDLVHLTLQCQGDADLENELLALFCLESQSLAGQLADPNALSFDSKVTIAHRLRGSALAIGAVRVARAAAALESLARGAGGEQMEAISRASAALEAAVAEVAARIALIRS